LLSALSVVVAAALAIGVHVTPENKRGDNGSRASMKMPFRNGVALPAPGADVPIDYGTGLKSNPILPGDVPAIPAQQAIDLANGQSIGVGRTSNPPTAFLRRITWDPSHGRGVGAGMTLHVVSDRLAWVVVYGNVRPVFVGGNMTAEQVASMTARTTTCIVVFVVDAATGDGIIEQQLC
jgi:hypothetical protein